MIDRLSQAFPYYINHLIVASAIVSLYWLAIGDVVPVLGAMFYVGREIRDWQKLGYFDWPGFLWPVVPLASLEIYLRFFV